MSSLESARAEPAAARRPLTGARLRRRLATCGRHALLAFVSVVFMIPFFWMITLSTMMIPSIVTFIPTYVLFKYLGLLGTYAPLVLPSFLGNAFFIFMLRQFYMGLPWELSEAARVDGAGEFLIFWQIMLPLVRSALLVVAVFTFLWTWHDFFGPLIYLSSADQYPLSLGLYAFRNRYVTQWDLLMAAATLTTVPLIALFFLAQRYFLDGVALTGIKA